MKKLQLYVIPAGASFVDALAGGLLERYGEDPLRLSRVRVLLPSRRACRSLREAFLRGTEGRPLLLPRMQPVGEAEAEDILFAEEMDEELLAGALALPEGVPPMRRLMTLTRLVWQANRQARLEQSARMAVELARLLDAAEREELPFDGLKALAPEEYAMHWQKVLAFLEVVSRFWPDYLREHNQLGAVERRSRLTRLLAAQWRKRPPGYPVIAAGTTGSVPATAELLKAVAGMPEGMVVLPGLDTAMPEAEWEQLEDTHPQYGLKLLLESMGAARGEVEPFPAGGAPPMMPACPRAALLRRALQPAEATAGWPDIAVDPESVRGLRMLECDTVQQEAKAIALMLRETLEHEAKTAALVTPDRGLARRVSAALKRYGLTVDDSAGMALADTPSAVFLRLAAQMAEGRAAPAPLLSLLKHPLAGLGMPPARAREAARQLELLALRGVRFAEGLDGLREYVSKVPVHPDRHSRLLGDGGYSCLALLERLTAACAPFLEMFTRRAVSPAELLEAHLHCAQALADTDEESGSDRLWRGDKGESLGEALAEIRQAVRDFPPIDPSSYPGLLDTLLRTVTWRPRYGAHPRLHILSPMEARLQRYDLLILGGLNEGVWPGDPPADPWMSRPMRARFGLPAPERGIGQQAHDFYMLAAGGEAVLTRSRKSGGAMTVPSRWWARLRALLEKSGHGDAVQDDKWKDWAARLDRPARVAPVSPPAPRPPLSARPRRLSVTQVERLLRDPYGVYARHVLGLKKLEPLDKDPGLADFGAIVHEALERFVRSFPGIAPDHAYEELLRCGHEAFAPMAGRPSVEMFWRPRFERIARWIAAEEQARRKHIAAVSAEISGEYGFRSPGGDFTIHARADRVEIDGAGGITLVDYKTGAAPGRKDVMQGLSPQLPLEALIAREGGFPGLGRAQVTGLEYWKLSGGEDAGEIIRLDDTEELMAAAESGLKGLIAAFDRPDHPYLACPLPAAVPKYNDYFHLARIQEWGGY